MRRRSGTEMTGFDPERPLNTACDGRGGKATAGRPGAPRSDGLRCAPTALRFSVPRPAAELASLTSFAALGRRPRVSLGCALARAASGPAMLGVLNGRPRPARRRLAVAAWRMGKHHCRWRGSRPAGRLVKHAGVPLPEGGWRGAVEHAGAPSWRGLGGAHGNRVARPKGAEGAFGSQAVQIPPAPPAHPRSAPPAPTPPRCTANPGTPGPWPRPCGP